MGDSFTADLMWDSAGRDLDAERTELARTAALADTGAGLWPLVAAADDETDLGHRLTLADPSLQAIAERRGYPAADLRDDLIGRWRLLAEARADAGDESAPSDGARERAMDGAVARLAARAADENPDLPMTECLRMAAEAVRKTADAHPLNWESFGHVPDGPFTERLKNWQPPKLPGKSAPAAEGVPFLPTPARTPPRVTPSFSDAPGRDIPMPPRSERPAPTSFSDALSDVEPRSRPAAPAAGGFSSGPAAGPASPPNPAAAAPAAFSDADTGHSPTGAPTAPAAGGFSSGPAPHITPPRPAGPPAPAAFSG